MFGDEGNRKKRRFSDEKKHNIDLFLNFVKQGFNKGNLDALNEICAPDYKESQSSFTPPNLEGLKNGIRAIHAAYSHFYVEVLDITADGDQVWARSRAMGIHTGSFSGWPVTGRRFRIQVIDICRFENGLMKEHWGMSDQMALYRQLGAWVMPPQAPRRHE